MKGMQTLEVGETTPVRLPTFSRRNWLHAPLLADAAAGKWIGLVADWSERLAHGNGVNLPEMARILRCAALRLEQTAGRR